MLPPSRWPHPGRNSAGPTRAIGLRSAAALGAAMILVAAFTAEAPLRPLEQNVGTPDLVGSVFRMRNTSTQADVAKKPGSQVLEWHNDIDYRLLFDFKGAPLTETGSVLLRNNESLTRTMTSGATTTFCYSVWWEDTSVEPAVWRPVAGALPAPNPDPCPDPSGLMDTRPKIIVY